MWDVFISHAWEDKASVAKPLADALISSKVSVWYDELTLKLGDGLRGSIDKGINGSRFGVVILSPDFFRKNWPQRELDGLATRELRSGKTILPVLHRLTRVQLEEYSPTLADKISVSTDRGLDAVVREILSVVRPDALGAHAAMAFDPDALLRTSGYLNVPTKRATEPKWASLEGLGLSAAPAGKVLADNTLGYSASFFYERDWEMRGPVSVDGYVTEETLRGYIEKQQTERARRLNRGFDTAYIDHKLDQTRRMIASMKKEGVSSVDYLDENLKDLPASLRRMATEILNLDNPDSTSSAKGTVTQRMLDNARSRYLSDGRKPSPLIDQLAEALQLH